MCENCKIIRTYPVIINGRIMQVKVISPGVAQEACKILESTIARKKPRTPHETIATEVYWGVGK